MCIVYLPPTASPDTVCDRVVGWSPSSAQWLLALHYADSRKGLPGTQSEFLPTIDSRARGRITTGYSGQNRIILKRFYSYYALRVLPMRRLCVQMKHLPKFGYTPFPMHVPTRREFVTLPPVICMVLTWHTSDSLPKSNPVWTNHRLACRCPPTAYTPPLHWITTALSCWCGRPFTTVCAYLTGIHGSLLSVFSLERKAAARGSRVLSEPILSFDDSTQRLQATI